MAPEQFEAYRDVGVSIARQHLAELFADGRPSHDALFRNAHFADPPPPRQDAPRPSA